MTLSNRFIEFPVVDKQFIKFLALKTISFLIDMMVIFMILVVEYLVTGNVDLLNISIYLYIMLWGITYNSIMIVACKGTLGMLLTKLKIVHKTGFLITNMQLFSRSFMNSMYTIPFIGIAAAIANIPITLIFKGFSIIDFFSQTILVTKSTYNELKNEEDNFLKNEIDEINQEIIEKKSKEKK